MENWPKREAERLEELVGDRPFVEKYMGYLKEMAASWREFAGKGTALFGGCYSASLGFSSSYSN